VRTRSESPTTSGVRLGLMKFDHEVDKRCTDGAFGRQSYAKRVSAKQACENHRCMSTALVGSRRTT
jgi:hypothetical protein